MYSLPLCAVVCRCVPCRVQDFWHLRAPYLLAPFFLSSFFYCLVALSGYGAPPECLLNRLQYHKHPREPKNAHACTHAWCFWLRLACAVQVKEEEIKVDSSMWGSIGKDCLWDCLWDWLMNLSVSLTHRVSPSLSMCIYTCACVRACAFSMRGLDW